MFINVIVHECTANPPGCSSLNFGVCNCLHKCSKQDARNPPRFVFFNLSAISVIRDGIKGSEKAAKLDIAFTRDIILLEV